MFINGEYVDDELIRLEASTLKQQLRTQMPGSDELSIAIHAQEWARENVIERVLLRMAAQQDTSPIPAEVLEKTLSNYYANEPRHSACMLPRDHQALKQSIELNLRIERLIARLTEQLPRPSSREVTQYYNQFKQSFHMPELVHAAHIVKNVDETTSEADALSAITAIQKLLAAGANFEEVADTHSDCPGQGGDLGFFPRGSMVDEFENVVFAMAPGQISEVFLSPFGYHIAKLYERKPAGIRNLNQVRPNIEKLLSQDKRGQAIRSFLQNLRSRAEIRKSNRSDANVIA